MSNLFKHIFFYLVFFFMVFGIILLGAAPGGEIMGEDGSMPVGFYFMFLSMMAFWILVAAIRWFDYYDQMEAPHRTVTKIIGIVGGAGVVLVQTIIRTRYEIWNPFSCYFTPYALENLAGKDIIFTALMVVMLLLSGVVGYCFFSQFTHCAGGKVIEITTYYTSDGLAYDRRTSEPFTPIWSAVLLGVLTTVIPLVLCGGVSAFPLLAYFIITLIRYKNRRQLVKASILGIGLSVIFAIASISPLFF